MSPARQGRGSAPAEAVEERPETEPWEAEAEEHPSSFDPGVETGYLRRGGRDHDLEPEIGAAPFDPGPDHYDDRRAQRAARRADKTERKRRKQEEQRREAAEREAARERERRETAKRELERAREKRERAARLVAERRERERAAQLEQERAARGEQLARERRERERLERLAREREQFERERRERERAAHLERERRLAAERQRQLQRRREHARREEAERARRAGSARERIERERAPRATPSPSPKLKRVPAAATPGPRPRVARRPRRSLRRPTLKAAVALAAVSAAAIGTGALLGLPLPGLGSSAEPGRSAAALGPATEGFTLDGGTPVGLSSGPYFPVVLDQPADYGEADAKFHADRGGRRHEGLDVFARPGTPLIAVRDGIVLDGAGGRNFYSAGGGNTLVIYSPLDDRSYVYLHMLKPALVGAGDEVRAGQPVGQVGCTGSCFGPHLHFEVRNGRADWGAETKAVDPLPIMREWPQVPRTQK